MRPRRTCSACSIFHVALDLSVCLYIFAYLLYSFFSLPLELLLLLLAIEDIIIIIYKVLGMKIVYKEIKFQVKGISSS